ncbi:hypothetical protein QE430_003332 [Microbacterium testaceum]|uniref:hypothetical protein n=1 Tax=Microbacterium testaceum TaxID=2033 RepID=UPI0027842471|nr:hypothetical protein [Microbacterium testaceum]MDQ1175025.1 hypothetical protein [Microbacterium testaceum]
MTPETPPPQDHGGETERPRGDPRFGPDAQASVDRSLAVLHDAGDALRVLRGVETNGSAFAAYLMLTDTNLAADDLIDRFHDAYVDAWESFAEIRRDILENLGWLDAVKHVRDVQGIPEDQLIWNTSAIDQQILDTYDAVLLDGWWHLFNK